MTQAVHIHCKTSFYNKMFDDTDVVLKHQLSSDYGE